MADSIEDLVVTNDIFWSVPDWATPVKYNPDFTRIITEYTGTTQHFEDFGDTPPARFQLSFTNLSREKENEILSFYNSHRGMHKRFWAPIWSTQFVLDNNMASAGPSGVVFARTVDTGFRNVFTGNERIFIRLHNGDRIVRGISSVQLDNAQEVIYFTTPIDTEIQISDIANFGRLILGRFNTDRLAMEYITPTVSKCTLEIAELIHEYDVTGLS